MRVLARYYALRMALCAFQGQMAVQQVIKDKAAAAQQRAEDFRQKQSRGSRTSQAPVVSMQV